MTTHNVRVNLQVQIWPISRLIPRITNPRTHSQEQIAQIAASMQEWGWTNPILVGADDEVIAGHARLSAARLLGMQEVPVIELGHLTEAQRRALVIADNQLAVNAGWDEELLRLELAALEEANFDLSLLGFDDENLERLLAEESTPAEGEDLIPETPEKRVSVSGDLWVLQSHDPRPGHRLLCSDATVDDSAARLLHGQAPFLMVTDPPYGVGLEPEWRQEVALPGF
jgi:ParB-like chromosome segregation protein Spo0J